MSLKTLTEKIIQYVNTKISRIDEPLKLLLEATKGEYLAPEVLTDYNEVNRVLNAVSEVTGKIKYLFEIDPEECVFKRDLNDNSKINAFIYVNTSSFQEIDEVKYPILRKIGYSLIIQETVSTFGAENTYSFVRRSISTIRTFHIRRDTPKVLMVANFSESPNLGYLGSPIDFFYKANSNEWNYSFDDTYHLSTLAKSGDLRPLNEMSPLEWYNGFVKRFTNRHYGDANSSSSIPNNFLNTINISVVNGLVDLSEVR